MYVLEERDARIYYRLNDNKSIYASELSDELRLYFNYTESQIRAFIYNWIWANTNYFDISKFWYRRASTKTYDAYGMQVRIEPNHRFYNLIAYG